MHTPPRSRRLPLKASLLCLLAVALLSFAAGWPWDFLVPQSSQREAGGLQSATILRCHDGDTCTARMHDSHGGSEFRLRLVGIDAPELGKGREGGQSYAVQSRDALIAEIAGREVGLRTWGSDRYGRSLSEVYLGRKNVNVWMVQQGNAEVYRGRIDLPLLLQAYLSAELQAQRDGRGIWAAEEGYESPRRYRHRLARD